MLKRFSIVFLSCCLIAYFSLIIYQLYNRGNNQLNTSGNKDKLPDQNLPSDKSKIETSESFPNLKLEYYQVQSGDTLNKIADENQISVQTLKQANSLQSEVIKQGKLLYIPAQNLVAFGALNKNNLYISQPIVNVYKTTSSNSEIVTQGIQGEPVIIEEEKKSWVKIKLPHQQNYSGWIDKSAIQNIEDEKTWYEQKIINVTSAKLYLNTNDQSEIITTLPLGTIVFTQLNSSQSNFTLIKLVDGRKGYVSSNNLQDYSTYQIPLNPETITEKQQTVINTAEQLLGKPYVWGGMTSSGVDCSGFIHTVFKVNGINLHRDADLQYYHDGYLIAKEDLQTGDLVFFETYKKGPSHLGIYIDNGQFIHAGSSKGVSYNSLNEPYFAQRFIGAKRVIESP